MSNSPTSKLPSFSIVTPSFNQAAYLEQTIQSVLSQDYPDVEYFVFDGGSTDGSIDILKRHSSRLTFWQSQKDRGQSDAIARGFEKAGGTLLNWLNSDDLLTPGALWRIAEMYRSNPEAGIYAASVDAFTEGSPLSVEVPPANLDLESLLFLSGRTVRRHQPGVFFTSHLYRLAGPVRQQFHFCMDFDIHARMILAGGKPVYSNDVVARFRQHASAKTSGTRLQTASTVREYMTISEEIGLRAGLRPNHREAHLHTLCGAIALCIARAQWEEARQCFALARSIAGTTGVVTHFASQAWRRLFSERQV